MTNVRHASSKKTEQEGGKYIPSHVQDAVAVQRSLESAGIDAATELMSTSAPGASAHSTASPSRDSAGGDIAMASGAVGVKDEGAVHVPVLPSRQPYG